ncbi:MAG: DNA mismatch repair ATPase MutS [Candidatus Azotimanducaceae bacterium]
MDDVLVLDAHTLKDLEIFGSEEGQTTLFEFCNHTRTEGGAKALKRRMEFPWSNAGRIRSTQESVSYILANRQAFTKLPSAYAATRTEYYSHEVMPIVIHANALEFTFGAFSLWANHASHYLSIVRGVQIACRLIRALREFLRREDLALAQGELAPLIEEMRTLVDRAGFALVPVEEVGSWAWRILRLDQVFRLQEKETLARLLVLIYEIDALVTMADVTRDNEFILPDIEEGPLRVLAEGLIHPFLEKPVPNPVEIDQQRRVLFLTGPNMAGKTTYLRSFATAFYLAHLGMGVPAKSFSFVPAQRLFSAISLSDDLRGGISYFRAEALRAKAVAKAISEGHRVVAIMDEPFKGTNVKDALDASLAILERLATKNDCLFMFSSHLIELSDSLSTTNQIDCRNFEAEEGEGRLRFDYLLRPGVSSQRLGMRVLREEGVFDLLDADPQAT